MTSRSDSRTITDASIGTAADNSSSPQVLVPPRRNEDNAPRRRGGRAVECTGLENRRPRKGIASSNLALSANQNSRLRDTHPGAFDIRVAAHPLLPSLHPFDAVTRRVPQSLLGVLGTCESQPAAAKEIGSLNSAATAAIGPGQRRSPQSLDEEIMRMLPARLCRAYDVLGSMQFFFAVTHREKTKCRADPFRESQPDAIGPQIIAALRHLKEQRQEGALAKRMASTYARTSAPARDY
jgi:hypothetical protein